MDTIRYIPTCAKCGIEIDIYNDDPTKDICQDCCDCHEYVYDKWRRGKFCKDCDAPIPDDYYLD